MEAGKRKKKLLNILIIDDDKMQYWKIDRHENERCRANEILKNEDPPNLIGQFISSIDLHC
jgi:hypothetical protein